MLGWALKKGFQGATGNNHVSGAGEEDTTQFDAPDTPAPVFAARAIKHAIFGAPKVTDAAADPKRAELSKKKTDNKIPTNMTSPTKQSPSKQPTSILLTPGTGTTRRKRVSFNHDVKASNHMESSPLGSARQRRTSLRQALENSRSSRSKKPMETLKEEDTPKSTTTVTATNTTTNANEWEDEWEDDQFNHDMTMDLNDPHSESGKYWKAEFNRYREEAMADIERMVKFKALAKSYAQKKDSEALSLAQQLKEEQTRVAKMEEKLAAMTAQIGDKKRRGSDSEDATLMKDLAKQTSLAAQYRDQVKELAALLKDQSKSSQSDRRRIDTSPRTEQTLLETNRELRRARSELKQVDKLHSEIRKLKSELSAAEDRAEQAIEERTSKGASNLVQIKKLEEYLRRAKEESREKDQEIRSLKKDYNTLKRDAKSRTSEAMQVLQEKNDKIAELEKNIKALQAETSSTQATRDLKSNIETLGKPSKYEGKYEGDKRERRSHHRRSTSAEDNKLNINPKPMILDIDEPLADAIRRPDTFLPSDWSDSYKDIKNQLRGEMKEVFEANKRERDSIMEDIDLSPPRPLRTRDTDRIMSTIRANKLNQPIATSSRHLTAKEILEEKLAEARGAARREAKEAEKAEKAEMHDALEERSALTPRLRTRSYHTRPRSSGDDAPQYDLAQDKFARLGGSDPERSTSSPMNNSRCTLPADRRAAALARLQQKKLERQKYSGNRSRDKENVKP
ncbi:spindle pole body formation-associated protein-domain-containing protein [Hypoxylon fragiforme]|uniref:spindle pole body formation-associated protein-domain-containing protein n=1 Tax=Hypoxylon fragiforme TaxID=63214 RepID=UPI0020C5F4FE|nr:spindle pole body formation-associated protein-domain-containing protein [Hypoxylon fragiforme]KAI2608296.1 spindle pole body formation-associated protein-domain-containing protein [Hypoxylon fragiforme]